jgi:hypothetical protein
MRNPCAEPVGIDPRAARGVASIRRAGDHARRGNMKTLSALVERDSFDVPAFVLDHFQKKVRENLHLEFFLARGRLIVTPHLSHLTTDEASPAEEERVRAILEEKQDLLSR